MINDPSRHWATLVPLTSGLEFRAAAADVEAAGLRGVACPQVWGSPFVSLPQVAAATTRIDLLAGAVNAFARSPFETACSAIDLDRLSDGRLILGLGASYREWNEGWFGLPHWGKPVARMRETVEVIRLVIAKGHTGELDRYDGEYHRHDWSSFGGMLAPPVRPEIPVWLFAWQSGMARLAAEIADGLSTVWPPQWALDRGVALLADSLRAAGRERADLHWQSTTFVNVNDDRAEAIEDARFTVAHYAAMAQMEPLFATYGFAAEAAACRAHARNLAAAAAHVSDEMVEAMVVVGSADECRKQLAPMFDVVDSFQLVPSFWGVSPEKFDFYSRGIAETFWA
ncbi:MAG: LLM class flavin-dependent oxidoreductase [Sporichthyaceae bacterium]